MKRSDNYIKDIQKSKTKNEEKLQKKIQNQKRVENRTIIS